MSNAQELIIKLSDKNNNIKYNRKFFKNKIFPFYTRNPERAKFEHGFQGVLGSLTRLSLESDPLYDGEDSPISIEKLDLDFSPESLKDEIITELTSNQTINSLSHPYFLNYIPSSNNSDNKGEIEIAKLLLKLVNLDSNASWKNNVGRKESTNLLEKIIIDSLNRLDTYKQNNEYTIFNKDNYKHIIEDLEYLSTKNDYFMKNVQEFFAFYYFQYILQTTIYLNNFENKKSEFVQLYYTLESERISSTRNAVKRGFNMVTSLRDDLLTNDTLIGYLNYLIDSEKTYSIQEILAFNDSEQLTINNELILFMKEYSKMTSDKNFNQSILLTNSLLDNIKLLKTWLQRDLTSETKSRFFKSIEEIGNHYFLKSRGPLGKVLSLNTDTIILLSSLIVKDNTMILHDVFKGFEERGVWFDQYTKEEIVSLYERMNILDKKSDSGEAKYVKPIL